MRSLFFFLGLMHKRKYSGSQTTITDFFRGPSTGNDGGASLRFTLHRTEPGLLHLEARHETKGNETSGASSTRPIPIAAFDLDGTIITTKGSHIHPRDHNDWRLLFSTTKTATPLQRLIAEGFRIVFFTNQPSLENRPDKKELYRVKLHNIIRVVYAFVACAYDNYRKPCTGMWDYAETWFAEQYGCTIDKQRSFYVGDAAGRHPNWKPGAQKDWACTDRKLALNLGIQFLTPEQFFSEDLTDAPFEIGFDPRRWALADTEDTPEPNANQTLKSGGEQEMIIFVGAPASGKTSFANTIFPHYTRLDPAEHSKDAMILAVEAIVKQGGSLVIDAPNSSTWMRSPFLQIARRHQVRARCLHFVADINVAMHCSAYRQLTSGQPRYGKSALVKYFSGFQPPTEKEGFVSVTSVEFRPNFSLVENQKLFTSFLH